MRRLCSLAVAAVVTVVLAAGAARAQEPPRVVLELEAGGLWLTDRWSAGVGYRTIEAALTWIRCSTSPG